MREGGQKMKVRRKANMKSILVGHFGLVNVSTVKKTWLICGEGLKRCQFLDEIK